MVGYLVVRDWEWFRLWCQQSDLPENLCPDAGGYRGRGGGVPRRERSEGWVGEWRKMVRKKGEQVEEKR